MIFNFTELGAEVGLSPSTGTFSNDPREVKNLKSLSNVSNFLPVLAQENQILWLPWRAEIWVQIKRELPS